MKLLKFRIYGLAELRADKIPMPFCHRREPESARRRKIPIGRGAASPPTRSLRVEGDAVGWESAQRCDIRIGRHLPEDGHRADHLDIGAALPIE